MTSQKPKKARKKNSVTETRKHQQLKNLNPKKKLIMTSQKPKKARKKNSVTETRKHQQLKNLNPKKKLKKLKKKKLEMLLAAQDKPEDANAKIDPWCDELQFREKP